METSRSYDNRGVKPTLLVVDDHAELRSLMAEIFQRRGFEVREAADGASTHSLFQGVQPDVVLLDLSLPDVRGLDLLSSLKRQWPETEVIVLSGYASLEAAVEATKRGAFHVHSKPHNQALFQLVDRALERKRHLPGNHGLTYTPQQISGEAPILHSGHMKRVVHVVERVASADIAVLITGESGTGKEVVANLLHELSPRRKGPFIKINCAALPRELIESELFGSVKGAFTGALAYRPGLFGAAEGGTLLLDELCEMPIETQSKLLRVLQERKVRPVGGSVCRTIDCRIITATNQRPENAIRKGKLREDLFYRLSAISIQLEPLRNRREDILPLAQAFLKRFAAQADRRVRGFSPEAAEQLNKYDWPGNVRQLQNEIQRAVLVNEDELIDVTDLSIPTSAPLETQKAMTVLEEMERKLIITTMRETAGNKIETCRRLGIGRQTLYNKIKSYALA